MKKFTTDTSYSTPNPDTGMRESEFRERVRELLDLDWSVRNEQLFAELRRLKQLEARVKMLNLYVDVMAKADV